MVNKIHLKTIFEGNFYGIGTLTSKIYKLTIIFMK